MNHMINEHVSALMDGELERDQARFLLKRMGDDADLPLRWARYHVARQTLRRQEVVVIAGFADRVMAAIELEPVASGRAASVRARHSWVRWGAGGAIAASVAVAALVLVQPQRAMQDAPAVAARSSAPVSPSPLGPAPVIAASVSVPASIGGFQPPLLVPNAPIETAPVSFGSDLAQPMVMDPRVQSYVLRHYQSAGSEGQAVMVPYVLLAVPKQDVVPQAEAQSR